MWSRKYDKCLRCGKNNFRHVGKGLCSSCYAKDYKSDPDRNRRVEKQKADWYRLHHEDELLKRKSYREQRNFDGKREAVLNRDGCKCRRCGSSEDLVVHHKDGKGRGSDLPNNDISNLETLCRGCHLEEHRDELRQSRRLRANGYWAKDFSACVSCGSNDKRHGGKGLCSACYSKAWRGSHKI